MAAPLAAVGVAAVAALAWLFGSDDSASSSPAPGGGGAAPAPIVLTCDQAVAALPPDLASTAATLLTSTPNATTRASALTLAVAFETSASQPGVAPMTRAALLTSAKCLRDWAGTAPAVTPVAIPALPTVPTVPTTAPPVKTSSTMLAAPQLYGDANGVEWLVTQETTTRWLAQLNEAPPNAAYASGLPFVRGSKDQIVDAIEERAAVAAGG